MKSLKLESSKVGQEKIIFNCTFAEVFKKLIFPKSLKKIQG